MNRCSEVVKRGTAVVLLCSALGILGCESSSVSAPQDAGNDGLVNDGVDASDSTPLRDAVNNLAESIVNNSKEVLKNLNIEISVAGVPDSLADCIDAAQFPVLDYYCGSEGGGVRLNDFGYPIHEFSFVRNEVCESSLTNEQTDNGCILAVAEAELEQNWFLRYRYLSEQNSVGVSTLQVSKGFFSSINDPSFSTDICVVTLLGSEIVSYNDVVYCNSVLRDVANLAVNY